MKKAIMVSVICLAYNHERYIRKALEGFVMQKTDFPFEVIVHDDASTDGTRSIIEEYVEKYPNLFVPVYQTENQYSKGIKITQTFALPYVRGKYIAFCEGDDFWCNENKLQIQFDYMEAHPDCSMCVHNSGKINEKGEDIRQLFGPLCEEKDLNAEVIIENYLQGLFHTASFFYRTQYRLEQPENVFHSSDYPTACYMAIRGTVHYMPQVMAYYRMFSEGSWTAARVANPELQIMDMLNFRKIHMQRDAYTDGKYTHSFKKAAQLTDYLAVILMYQHIFPQLPLKKRLKALLYGFVAVLDLWEIARFCKRKWRSVFHAKY